MEMHVPGSKALSDDLIEGAAGLAEFVFGNKKDQRKIYHLVDKGGLPHFRLGSKIYARKSVILQWVAEQERLADTSRAN